MKRCIMGLMIGLCLCLLGGCTMKDIEAQAYAVSLGIDLTQNDRIEVSVQVPTLNQSSGGDSGGGGGSDSGSQGYTFSTAQGETLTQALEMLNAGMTRELNLTGVKSIVISERLARNQKFRTLLEELALSYRVYGAAEIVICSGEARKFIAEQKAVIGLRLSESTTVSLRHYRETGYIPSAKAADVYYLSRSIYGDPAAIFAAVHEEGQKEAIPGTEQEAYAGELNQTGDNKNQYFGAALFSDGIMVGRLNGVQTQMLNVLRGDLKQFSWIVDQIPVRINVSGAPDVSVQTMPDRIRIDVSLEFEVMHSQGGLSAEQIERLIVLRLNELTEYCQRCASDPFRYAERAVRCFANTDSWLKYDWRGKFPQAQIEYAVKIKMREL